MYVRPVLLTTLLVMITFGSGLSKALAGNATVLFFVEQERRAVPRNTRVIVTSKYVPIDDGEDAGDFLLFDRAKRSIFATNSLDKRILMINAGHWNCRLPHRSSTEQKRAGRATLMSRIER